MGKHIVEEDEGCLGRKYVATLKPSSRWFLGSVIYTVHMCVHNLYLQG